MYNFSELITSHVVIQKFKTKHPCKANFSVAVQVCRQFLLGNVSPPDVEASITPRSNGRISISMAYREDTEKLCDTSDEVLEYMVGSDRLRDVITQVTVLDRSI